MYQLRFNRWGVEYRHAPLQAIYYISNCFRTLSKVWMLAWIKIIRVLKIIDDQNAFITCSRTKKYQFKPFLHYESSKTDLYARNLCILACQDVIQVLPQLVASIDASYYPCPQIFRISVVLYGPLPVTHAFDLTPLTANATKSSRTCLRNMMYVWWWRKLFCSPNFLYAAEALKESVLNFLILIISSLRARLPHPKQLTHRVLVDINSRLKAYA